MRRTFDARWLVVAATLLAVFSRFYRLTTIPPQAWVDEVWFSLRARDFLETGQFQVYFKTFWGGVHPLLVYLTALVEALGFSKSIVASRFITTLCGVVSVPLAYACLDELGRGVWPVARRRWIAALTAVVLSNLTYTVIVGRVGTEPVVALGAGLFCIWQMRRAVRTGRWTNWLASGLLLGLAQYISPHARFIAPVVGWMALHELWRARDPLRLPLLIRLLSWGLISLVAASPLLLFFASEPQWVLARVQAITPLETGWLFYLNNFRLVLLSFNWRGALNLRDNLPGRPMFDVIQSVGLWGGALWAAAHWRRHAMARDLLIWAACMMLPSILTDEAPQFERMIGLAVPVAALVAIGWVMIGTRVMRRVAATRWERFALPALAGLVGLSVVGGGYDFFIRYPQAPGLAAALTTTPVNLAEAMRARAATEGVFVERVYPGGDVLQAEDYSLPPLDVFAFNFLLRATPVQRMDFRQCLPLTDHRASRTTYLVLEAHDQQTTPTLLQAYPGATLTRVQPEEEALMGRVALIEIPADTPGPSIAHTTGAQFDSGISLVGYDWSGPQVKAGESVFMTLYWKTDVDLPEDFITFLHVGTGLGDSRNVAQRDGQPCQGIYPTSHWRAGDLVPDGFAITLAPDTPPGDYPLAVGWYRYPSLARLPLTAADNPLPDDRAVIATLTVTRP
jgi:hypothetical protein